MSTDFSAVAASLGYLYQLRYALLLLLEQGEGAEVCLERLDDIEAVSGGATTLHQLKLHKKGNGDLSDTSVDLWKTLRVWASQVSAGKVPLPGALFALVTTAQAPMNSAASLLKPAHRDPAAALTRLRGAAKSSKSKTLAPAFAAFNALTAVQQALLVEGIRIFDGAPGIVDVVAELRKRLALTTHPDNVLSLLERLEGWWFAQAIAHLMQKEPRSVLTFSAVQLKVIDIADQLQSDNLPIDFERAEPGVVDPSQDPRLFVQQLKAIRIRPTRIADAILDYYRACEQRSRWVREELILDDELSAYEDRLVGEWRRYSHALADELELDEASDKELADCGKRIYRWAEMEANFPIRRRVTAAYVMRGSFHMLADREPPRVWWHPQFLDTVKKTVLSAPEKP